MATTMPSSNGSYSEANSVPGSAGSGTAGSGFSNTSQSSTAGPEEIGWYFVQQYYTTLNGQPDRLHLFYNKKSSLVWGNEGENIAPAQGRQEISDKIKSLNFRDCKVRVTNVDSLASIGGGIVVQVLGQMTNNSEPNRRFSQTFFLAEQTNGYYVLNDIFRYLSEDDEDDEEILVDEPIEEPVNMPEEPVQEEEQTKEEETADVVQPEEPEAKEEVEEDGTGIPEPEAVAPINGVDQDAQKSESEAPAEVERIEDKSEADSGAAGIPSIAIPLPALPNMPVSLSKDEDDNTTSASPTPTPNAAPVQEEPRAPPPTPAIAPAHSSATVPSTKRTWANLLASSGPKAVPSITTPTPPQTSTTDQAPKESSNTARPTTPGTPSSAGGWQTTDSSRRQSRPVSISGPPEGQTQAYVKHVTDRVNPAALREALSKFGTIKHFEIVKARSCAFVDFAEPSQFLAAAAANPHRIGDQNVFVEERKQRSGGPPFPNGPGRGGLQGGRGDGRPNTGGRGGFQRSGTGDRGFDSSRGGSMGGRQGSGRGGSFARGGPRGGAVAS